MERRAMMHVVVRAGSNVGKASLASELELGGGLSRDKVN